jgi:hypothetical protein
MALALPVTDEQSDYSQSVAPLRTTPKTKEPGRNLGRVPRRFNLANVTKVCVGYRGVSVSSGLCTGIIVP